jgi:hypothetical protein
LLEEGSFVVAASEAAAANVQAGEMPKALQMPFLTHRSNSASLPRRTQKQIPVIQITALLHLL